MSLRSSRRITSFGLITGGILAVAVARGADEELVENPAYRSWAAHKVGTQTVSDMKTTMGAFTVNGEMTSTLADVNDERAVIESSTVMSIPGAPPQPPLKQKYELKAKVAKKDAESGLPEGVTGTSKPLPDETITAGGKEYACKVVEFEGSREGTKSTGKTWRNDEVPGQIVKVDMDATAAGNPAKIVITLKKVELK